MTSIKGRLAGTLARGTALLSVFAALCLVQTARADQILVSQSMLVSGSQSETVAFDAPNGGMVTVQLQNLNWPQQLDSLSFMASSATKSLTSWSDPTQTMTTETFQVAPGTYFAHVTGQAGGPLDLGLFSLSISLASPVPLPDSGALLVSALAALVLLFALKGRPLFAPRATAV